MGEAAVEKVLAQPRDLTREGREVVRAQWLRRLVRNRNVIVDRKSVV